MNDSIRGILWYLISKIDKSLNEEDPKIKSANLQLHKRVNTKMMGWLRDSVGNVGTSVMLPF